MELHEYQKKAIEFGLENKAVFMAMDLGLGKTAVALKIVQQLKQKAIVFAPLRVIYNTWPDEIKKWTPELTYDILHGLDKGNVFRKSKADILLINFDGLKWFSKEVLKSYIKWHKRILILDESSMIKSPSTLRFKLLKKMMPLWSNYRFCLSATPAPNGYYELWSQYYMLDKGEKLFPVFYQFRNKFFNYSGPPLYKTTIRKGAYEQIRDLIKPITYRLDANDYISMPDIIYNDIPLVLSSPLQKKYKELEDKFFLEFVGAEATAFSAAALSMKLRQFIQGAVYTDLRDGSFYPLHHIKIDALKELLETSAGQPILCAIQFKFELRMIHEFIDKSIPCVSGGTSIADANYFITAWNESKLPLLLCHPASLGHGVNLQAGGHIMLWFGLTWSLEHYKQLNGRLIRQGQKNASVTVNHLIMKNTIDERVVKVLKDKDASQSKLLDALKR
ncbi:MAG: DEAD/DEAH box helicase [Gammaproteobacteria bacterium]|nr:DEAD/DEAH box helicase [Gammaproteobacteria bacterium]